MTETTNFEDLLEEALHNHYSVGDYEWLQHLEDYYAKGLTTKPFIRDLEKARAKWDKHVFDRYNKIASLLRERRVATTMKYHPLSFLPLSNEPPNEVAIETVQFRYDDYAKTGDKQFFDSDKLYRDVLSLCKSEMEKDPCKKKQ